MAKYYGDELIRKYEAGDKLSPDEKELFIASLYFELRGANKKIDEMAMIIRQLCAPRSSIEHAKQYLIKHKLAGSPLR